MSTGGDDQSGSDDVSTGGENPGGTGPGAGSGGGTATSTTATTVEDLRLEIPVERPRRAENFVALCFTVSVLATIGLAITYSLGGQPQAEGALLGLGLAGIGIGLAAWGKYLMPQGPFVEDRHELPTTEKDKQAFGAAFSRGQVAVERRGFLGKLLGAAIGVFSIVGIFPFIRSLYNPRPGNQLDYTQFRRGSRLVQINGRPVMADDVDVGGVLTVFPEGHEGDAVSQTLLIRASSVPITTLPGRETWSPHGYLAYSKLCTHAGCPVSLYQQQVQQLLCPCHQSVFTILNGARPIFGPAPRLIPQLPIMDNGDGFLRAQSDYQEPVGPGYWERNTSTTLNPPKKAAGQ
ncbi:MAG: Rieske 2Fe-2S domain-containing protein [Actinobacteria bacterium]|nr:MAG: Rieske 2Fe-2S domain-containing protein [Actinomycetota bacterium]